jgi:sugar transferase EpsL
VLSPFILALAVTLRVTQGAPVLFRQQRPGMGARPFTIYKFRTMLDLADPEGQSDAQRTTRLGRKLRALSLDELPELWNVIKGDMSLVGPRPLLMAYLPRYGPVQARRHEVRPGITGLAQISGRNALTWDQKFALDVRYVDEHDLRMDLEILVRTVTTVLSREGVNSSDDETMPEFMGSGSPGTTQGSA